MYTALTETHWIRDFGGVLFRFAGYLGGDKNREPYPVKFFSGARGGESPQRPKFQAHTLTVDGHN